MQEELRIRVKKSTDALALLAKTFEVIHDLKTHGPYTGPRPLLPPLPPPPLALTTEKEFLRVVDWKYRHRRRGISPPQRLRSTESSPGAIMKKAVMRTVRATINKANKCQQSANPTSKLNLCDQCKKLIK